MAVPKSISHHSSLTISITIAGIAIAMFFFGRMLFSEAFAANSTVTVRPSAMQGWSFVNEGAVGSGTMVNGPAIPPSGTGSAQLTVDSTGREILVKAASGARLADIDTLSYSTYQQTGEALLEISLQFNIDDNVTDANNSFKGRLVFEPYQSSPVQATMTGAWQTWQPMLGTWWASPNANSPIDEACPQSAPCTWTQLITLFPNIGIHPTLGAYILRAGGPWTSGFIGNTDAFIIGISGDTTTYDFEPNLAAPPASSSSSVIASSSSLSSTGVCLPVATGSLVGHWKLDEGSGSTAFDSSGNGRHGTLMNGPDWTTGTPAISPNPSALDFDGTNDHVRVSGTGAFNFGSGSFTVSLYARTNSGNRSVLGNFNGTRGWGLFFYGNNSVNFFGYGTQGTNDAAKPATVLDNQWHHIAGVYTRSGSSLRIDTYVDGVHKGSNTATVGDISSTTPLLFGDYVNQPNYNGRLDEIKIYNRALAANEIGSLANACPGSSSSSSHAGTGSSISSVSSVPTIPSSSSSSVGGPPPTCNGMTATIFVRNGRIVGGPDDGDNYRGSLDGTNGNDVIVGTSGRDRIEGKNGNDTICGLGGRDRLEGDNGDDTIFGGGDRDDVEGGNGNDMLFGGADDDDIEGDNGDDLACGRGGNDDIEGDRGNDQLDGGAGNDDDLDGGRGNDVCANGEDVDDCTVTQTPIALCANASNDQ